MAHTLQPLILDLCAGAGMLGEAVALAAGGRILAHVEREACAAAVLLARMEESSLEPAPVWCGDLADFPAAGFAGLVDILAAGLPCQPYSLAGKRAGNRDHRSFGADGESGPLPGTLRLIGRLLPPVVFFENVPAWVAAGWFRSFGEALCGMGYEIEDPFFLAAEDVGCSHKRERVFIMALASGSHPERWRVAGVLAAAQRAQSGETLQRERHGDAAEHRGAAMAQPDERSGLLRKCEPERGAEGRTAAGGTGGENHESMGNAAGRQGNERERAGVGCPEGREGSGDDASDSPGRDGNAAVAQPAGARSERIGLHEPAGRQPDTDALPGCGDLAQPGSEGLPQPEPAPRPAPRPASELCGAPFLAAPGPADARWPAILAAHPHLAPALEPGLRLLADGMAVALDASRADQLRVTGNGVVPLQAALAFALLARRAAARLNLEAR